MVKGEYRAGGKLYPESVRKFCLRQQYYSTAAYNSLREFFNNNLPAKRTLQSWYGSLRVSPGICESALNILREKAELHQKENTYPLHLSIMSDEMSIRKEICWSTESHSFVGFSTITNASQQDEENPPPLKAAKDALVFMAVGSDFKIPIAYELLNGLESIDRAALTLNVIKEVESVGAIVFSLTGDGLIANVAAATDLGAKFDEDKPYFNSPTHNEQKIYIIFDPRTC